MRTSVLFLLVVGLLQAQAGLARLSLDGLWDFRFAERQFVISYRYFDRVSERRFFTHIYFRSRSYAHIEQTPFDFSFARNGFYYTAFAQRKSVE